MLNESVSIVVDLQPYRHTSAHIVISFFIIQLGITLSIPFVKILVRKNEGAVVGNEVVDGRTQGFNSFLVVFLYTFVQLSEGSCQQARVVIEILGKSHLSAIIDDKDPCSIEHDDTFVHIQSGVVDELCKGAYGVEQHVIYFHMYGCHLGLGGVVVMEYDVTLHRYQFAVPTLIRHIF